MMPSHVDENSSVRNETKDRYFASEPELGEEPSVLAGLKALLKASLGLLGCGDLLVAGLERIEGDDVLEIDVECVAGGHDVAIVHQLQKRLHARLLGRLLCGVLADHLLRVLGDAGHQAVPVGPLPGAVVEGSHDHRLPPRESPLQDDHRLVRLQKLHHLPLLPVSRRTRSIRIVHLLAAAM
ncbi:unnamed protein product, partial [Musa hybrid cultivar]